MTRVRDLPRHDASRPAHARRRCAAIVAALLVPPLAACGSAAGELAAGPAGHEAPRAFVQALADRFGPIDREPAFDALRPKLNRMSFVPSRGFDDTTAWTSTGSDWRAVELEGYLSGGAYRVGVRAGAPKPATPGAYWNRIRLQRLGDGRYQWTAAEELAVGQVRPADLAAALDALFRGAEHATGPAARTAIAGALPRSSAKFGQLFRLEALTLQRDSSGATYVRVAVRITPEGIRSFAARGAAYIEKYSRPLRLYGALMDPQGDTWWTLEASDHLWTLRLRIRDGSLIPLIGPLDRRLPAQLRAAGRASTRMGRFGVGAERVLADVSLRRTPSEKGLSARFLEEPDWKLPFLVETLLNSPLRYPFEDPGSQMDWAVRATDRGTMLAGLYRTRIRETWLVRWLGGMMGSAIDEYRAGAELEIDRYLRDCLLALRDDMAALAPPP